MVSVLKVMLVVFLALFQAGALAESAAVDSCRMDSFLNEQNVVRHKLDLEQLPDGIYTWERSHFFAEKILEDDSSVARMAYQEMRESKNKVRSAIVCMKGLHKKSPIESWKEYLPTVTTLVVENRRLAAFKLRKYLLDVSDKVEVEAGKLSIEEGRSLKDFIKYSGIEMEIYQLSGDRYQIQLSRQSNKGTSAGVAIDLIYQR